MDFRRPAALVRGQINGLNPWPCAGVNWQGERLKLLRAAVAETEAPAGSRPGEVLVSSPKEGLILACGDGAVRVLELQAPGGKKMRAEDFLRGHGIPVGTILGE